MHSQFKLFFFLFLFASGFLFNLPVTSYQLPITTTIQAATLDLGINQVDQSIALAAADPRVVIARIIRTALTLLGIFAVLLVLWGGFKWMTASGEEDKLKDAKRLLVNAAVGLAIVLSAWSITTFVLNRLIEATTGQVAGTGSGTGSGGGVGGGGDIGFRPFEIRPADPIPTPAGFSGFCRNTTIRIRMSEQVDAATVPDNLVLHYAVGPGDSPIEPTDARVSGNMIEVRARTPCEGVPGESCFTAGRTYKFNFEAGLRSAQAPFRSVTCPVAPLGGTPICGTTITIANCIDTESPEMSVMVPTAGQSIPPGWFTVRGRASDDQAVGAVEFYDGNSPTGWATLLPDGALSPVDASFEWQTVGLLDVVGDDPGGRSCRTLSMRADDVNNHSTRSSMVPVVVRHAHCFNNRQDDGETGLDCGGDPISIEYCGKCAGAACAAVDVCTNACRSGACVDGRCKDLPRIDRVDPVRAGPGSYVTIEGEFFGATPGSVTFLGGAGTEDDVIAPLAPCSNAWTSARVIVTVPSDARLAAGPIELRTVTDEFDRTDDGRGLVTSFRSDAPSLPGLCSVSPLAGRVGDNVALAGTGFGDMQGANYFEFRRRDTGARIAGAAVSGWTGNAIVGKVSPMNPGMSDVRVVIDSAFSNALPFEVVPPEAGTTPIISRITPADGPPGTYVTISGSNFGAQTGVVEFESGGKTGIGATNFPESCNIGLWQNDSIIIKAPERYSTPDEAVGMGRHAIRVRRASDGALSDAATFTVRDGTPGPGLCRLDPVSGPETTPVTFFGEQFGAAADTFGLFFNNILSGTTPGTTSSTEQFTAAVPDLAATGPVRVQIGSGDTARRSDNELNFSVSDCRETGNACPAGTECCSNGACSVACANTVSRGGYAWFFSTGPIPQIPRLLFECSQNSVPTPAPYSTRPQGDQVCANSVVTGRFSTLINSATLVASNFQFRSCTQAADNTISCATNVAFSRTSFLWSDPPGAGTRRGHGFELRPLANLLPNTWYEVKITTGIRGDTATTGGGAVVEDRENCGTGFSYCWRFKTRGDTAACTVGSIEVTPAERSVTEEGPLAPPYQALCRAATDACAMINCGVYTFSWSIPEVADRSRASVAALADTSQGTASALAETPSGNPVQIRGRIDSENKQDDTELRIDFVDPRVIEVWPNCQEACMNAGLGARFNTRMDRGVAESAGSVTVRECTNENCTAFSDSIGVASSLMPACSDPPNPEADSVNCDRELRVTPSRSFRPNTFYRAILSGRVRSRSGVALTGSNYGSDYSWIFRTRPDGNPCGVARVEVVPPEARVRLIGTRVPYSSFPFGQPDACGASGQELAQSSYNWTWTSNPITVANFVGGMSLDVNPVLPAGCTAQCTFSGSAGRFDRDAVCGDSVIEATKGEECDDGNIQNNDGCSRICLREGRPALVGAVVANILNQPNDFPVLNNYSSAPGDPNPQTTTQSSDAVSGSVSARIHTGSVRNGGGTFGGVIVDAPLAAQFVGRMYTLSYLAKNISAGLTRVVVSHQNGSGDVSTLTHSVALTDRWQRYSFTATLNAARRSVYFWTEEAPDRTFLLDDIRLVEAPAGIPAGFIAGEPPAAGATCGNSFIDIGEECDDGNTNNRDGCSVVCLNEGSALGGSVCGNESVGRGEDCDDASPGCSAICLRTGSHPRPFSICGNGGAPEAGESCDDGNLTNGDGCSDRCLLEGTPACRAGGPVACCGNGGAAQAGEECDDGNLTSGDGCSARCLFEGSSFAYSSASFCGDGARGVGEACEALAVGGDGFGDAAQVVQAEGRGEVIDGVQSSVVSAGTRTNAASPLVSATSDFKLQCGFRSDTECPNSDINGVGTNTCCYPRPSNFTSVPADEATGVCMNPLVTITFPERMQIASFTGNVLLARADSDANCASGETELTLFFPSLMGGARGGWLATPSLILPHRGGGKDDDGWFARIQSWLDRYLPFASATDAKPNPPASGSWCAGSVSVSVRAVANETNPPTTTVFVAPEEALAANTWYRVRVKGDNPSEDGVQGVRSVVGVGYRGGNADGSGDFEFHTGTQVCELDAIEVRDLDANPSVFTTPNSFHHFTATAMTDMPDGTTSPIAAIPGVYAWEWQPWTSSDGTNTIVRVFNVGAPGEAQQPRADEEVYVGNSTVNGTATISASAKITVDTIPPFTVDRTTFGALETSVFICENPWPGGPGATWALEDIEGGRFDDPAIPNATEFFGRFSVRYCRDAGSPGPENRGDDLPHLEIRAVPAPPAGIRKEFTLQSSASSNAHDVIGFRMANNPLHVSAARWYTQQGFRGSPQAMTIDGYDAVRDGRTVYVNAANIDSAGRKINSNIYIIGYNEGASAETVAIFEQLLSNLRFNINSPAIANQGVCIDATGVIDSDPEVAGVQSRACSANLDCPASAACRSAKDKVRRDNLRLEDFRDIEAALTRYRERAGRYPELSGGTFLTGYSTSAWPSWIEALSREAGAALPADPVNRFADCAGFDAGTCFSAAPVGVTCPNGNCAVCPLGSHVYQYRSNGPEGYRLSVDMEYQSGFAGAPYPEEWQLSSVGPTIFEPALPNPAVTFEVRWVRDFSCRYTTGSSFVRGASARCGDGIVGPNEACELGYRTSVPCGTVGVAGVGAIAVECRASCDKRCSGSGIQCATNADCGVGGICTEFVPQAGASCVTSFCGDGVVQTPNATGANEECDDGGNNGRYGFCGANCTRAAGAFCGDGRLAGTEQCDCGVPNMSGALPVGCSARNGAYGTSRTASCSFDCKIPGPYCGDNLVQTADGEQCDGNVRTGRGRCGDGSDVCNNNADCERGATCFLCTSETVNGITYERRITGTCRSAGASACRWAPVPNRTACTRVGGCGNGIVDGTEQCDDSNQDNNDVCTNACRANICGDGVPFTGVEACDFGAPSPARSPSAGLGKNGDPCVASYGGICNYCSSACTYVTQNGAFCGDGIFTLDREQCDRTAPTVSCRVCSGDSSRACTVNADCIAPQTCINSGQCINTAPGAGATSVSRCNLNCSSFCPYTFENQVVRFMSDTGPPSSSYAFSANEQKTITIPACRIGGGLTVDVSFGRDVLHFPSPMAVLFVLDNSGSMREPMSVPGVGTETRMRALRRALCGSTRPTCNALGDGDLNTQEDTDGAFLRLLTSRPSGDVKVGILEFGGTSRFRTSNQAPPATLESDEVQEDNDGNIQVCEPGDPTPCYDYPRYPGAPDAGTNGFLNDGTSGNPSNRDKLRRIVAGMAAENYGTKTYLALRHAKAILDDTDAASKVIILMSDGESTDCCSYPMTAGNDCQRNHNELNNGTPGTSGTPPASADDYCTVTSGACVPNPMSPIVVAGNPDCRFSHPDADALKNDGVTIFTVAYPAVISAMNQWATPSPSSGFSYSYGGNDVANLLNSIIGSLGVTIEVSGTGITTSTTTVEQDSLGVPLNIIPPSTNSFRNYCTDDGRSVNVRVRFTPLGTGAASKVTLSNARFDQCPLTEF